MAVSARGRVGMTQGARKRRALIEVVTCFRAKDADQPAWAWNLVNDMGRPRDRRDALLAAHEYMATDSGILGEEYEQARAAYRVGERLRPCPGCPACCTCLHCGAPAYCFGSYESHSGKVPRTYACDDCCGHGGEDGHCEPIAADEEGVPQRLCAGAGVLPARGAA